MRCVAIRYLINHRFQQLNPWAIGAPTGAGVQLTAIENDHSQILQRNWHQPALIRRRFPGFEEANARRFSETIGACGSARKSNVRPIYGSDNQIQFEFDGRDCEQFVHSDYIGATHWNSRGKDLTGCTHQHEYETSYDKLWRKKKEKPSFNVNFKEKYTQMNM